MRAIDSDHSISPSVWPLDASRYLLWIGIYFALHILTRSLISRNLQLDEAEQLVLTQDWLWGYGSQPLLFPLPLVLVGMMSGAFNRETSRRFCILAAVVAIIVLFAVNGTVILANAIGRPHNLNFPFETLAARIRHRGFNSDIIVADGFFLGGNLKMHFPERRIVVPQISKDFIQIAPHIVVWRSNGSNLPPMLDATAREVVSPAPQILDLPSNNGPKKSERIGIIMIQPAQRENRALAN